MRFACSAGAIGCPGVCLITHKRSSNNCGAPYLQNFSQSRPIAMLHTLMAAAAATGLDPSSILSAIRKGQIIANQDLFGEWHLESDELERLKFCRLDDGRDAPCGQTAFSGNALETQIGALIAEAGDNLRGGKNSPGNASEEPSRSAGPQQLAGDTNPANRDLVLLPALAPFANCGIRLDARDKIAGLISPIPARHVRPAAIAGALVVTLLIGWAGGWSSHHLLSQPGPVVQKLNPSAPLPGPAQGTLANSNRPDRQAAQSAARIGKVAARPTRFSHPPEFTQSIVQGSSPTKKSDAINDWVRPAIPVPETRPTTIEGWTVREVVRGVAALEGPNGIWKAAPGDVVPGLGRVESIVLWGSRWIVATSRGLITTE
jgi:hypothetical protein